MFVYGKVKLKTGKLVSSCMQVKGLEWIMYVLPRDQTSDCSEVRDEMDEKLTHSFKWIKNFRSRVVDKEYAFELPLKNGISEGHDGS